MAMPTPAGKDTLDTLSMLEAGGGQPKREQAEKPTPAPRVFCLIGVMLCIIALQTSALGGLALWSVYGANGQSIPEVRPSVANVSLRHALVLDMEHLRTIDEVTYQTQSGDLVSEKVVSVRRSHGDKMSSNVTLVTAAQTTLVLSPSGPSFWLDGEQAAFCGGVRCANFKIDDPELSPQVLDDRLVQLVGEGGARRLYYCPIPGFSWR